MNYTNLNYSNVIKPNYRILYITYELGLYATPLKSTTSIDRALEGWLRCVY